MSRYISTSPQYFLYTFRLNQHSGLEIAELRNNKKLNFKLIHTPGDEMEFAALTVLETFFPALESTLKSLNGLILVS